MKKRIAFLALALTLILSLAANAAQPRAVRAYPDLSFSGTTANCSVVIASPGTTINATLNLWMGNRLIGSWSGSGTSSVLISGSCAVTSGSSYTLRVTGNIDGNPIDGVPVSGTCG